MSVDEALEVEETNGDERGVTERKGRATPGKRSKSGGGSTDSGNFITRFFGGIADYFGGVRDEMTKVVWPTRDELTRLTYIVLLVTIASAAVLGILSFIYTWIFQLGINDNQPWVFVVVFALVGAAFLYFQRSSTDETSY